MCEFPSWIVDVKGHAHWLTDDDIKVAIETGVLDSWFDAAGHSAIEKVLKVMGLHMEGRKDLPAGFAQDIRNGRCNRMALTEIGHSIKYVQDLLPRGLLDNQTVGGNLFITGCTGLTELPAGLKVSGYLDISGCTGLTELPADLTVGGSLYLTGCTGLTKLPAGLKVGGQIYR